ncbi:MAG: helix-turn-helix transcriptional regulator [Crocosphaera sp.]|nr:helix-turn-helix transcriptional regulator [Crocosphaera sp.]
MKYEIIQKEGNSYAVIPVEMYQQLLEDSEMLADIKVYDQAKTRQEESFPLDIVERISINGEHPLKVWREYRHFTQQQLAETVGGISKVDISDIESGKKTVSKEILQAIATILNVDIDMISSYDM